MRGKRPNLQTSELVTAKGKVVMPSDAVITVRPNRGAAVTFTGGADIDLTGVGVGSTVEAEGVRQVKTVTLKAQGRQPRRRRPL